MANNQGTARIGIIGLGAMGWRVIQGVRTHSKHGVRFAVLVRHTLVTSERSLDIEVFTSVEDFVGWAPSKVVECAGHGAVTTCVPRILERGVPVTLASVGALADENAKLALDRAAEQGRTQYGFVSGAVGGLDALKAAQIAGLGSVKYTGRKAPIAWTGTAAERSIDLSSISSPTNIFNGNAREVCGLYPKNANVAAAIALSGIGFDRTEVALIADPSVSRNVHKIEAVGHFGRLSVSIENAPLEENPKTSMLAPLSILSALV